MHKLKIYLTIKIIIQSNLKLLSTHGEKDDTLNKKTIQ